MKWSITIVMIFMFGFILYGHGGFENLDISLEMWYDVIERLELTIK